MRLVLLGCCATVLLASGCGSSGTSQAAFRSRADAICRELGSQNGSTVNTKAALDRHLRRADARISELARLHPPSGEEHSYRDFIVSLERMMSLAKTRFPALIEMKSPSPHAIERIVQPLGRDVRRAQADARALGLGACARSISHGSGPSQPQDGPTPQQVKSPAKRAFDRQMLAVSSHYTNALIDAAAPFTRAFDHRNHAALEKATLTMTRNEIGIYNEEASAVARIKAPADARAEQQAIAAAYRVAAKQSGEFAVSYRHHGHSSIPRYLSVDWQAQLRTAVRRLEAKGYALRAFDALGTLRISSASTIVKSNQP